MEAKHSENQISVFISYAREDKWFARELQEILRQRGITSWLDDKEIRPTAQWEKEIQNAIITNDFVIYIASRNSALQDSYCLKELKFAKDNNKKIVPINIDTNLQWLPVEIQDIHWINFSSLLYLQEDGMIRINHKSAEFDQSFNMLISALETELDWVKTHSRLLEKAWEWKAQNKNTSYLLIGDELQYFKEAVNKYQGKEPSLTEDQVEIINESEIYTIEQFRRQKRSKKILALTLVTIMIIGVIALVLGVISRKKTMENLAIDLANKSELFVDNPDLSLLLAVNANMINPSSITKAALFNAILSNQYSVQTLKMPNGTQIDIAEDLLLVSYCILENNNKCEKSEIRLLEFETYSDALPPLQVNGGVYFPIISPEQKYIGFFLYLENTEKTMLYVYDIQEDKIDLKLIKAVEGLSLEFGFEENEIITGATGIGNGLIEFWDINTGNYLRAPVDLFGNAVSSLIMNPSNDVLFAASNVGLYKYNLNSGSIQLVSKNGAYHPYSLVYLQDDKNYGLTTNSIKLAMSNDGRFIASKGAQEIIIWDTEKDTSLDYLNSEYLDINNCMKFLPDTSILAYCRNSSIIFYDVDSHETVMSIDIPNISDFLISENGRYVIIYSNNHEITILDLYRENQLVKNEINIVTTDGLRDLSTSKNYIIVKDSESLNVLSNNLEELKCMTGKCHSSFALSTSGDEIALGCSNGKISLIELSSEKVLREYDIGEESDVLKLFITPDNSGIISISQSGKLVKFDYNSTSILFETQTGAAQTLVMDAVMSPDGKYIIVPAFLSNGEYSLININGDAPILSNPAGISDYIVDGSAIMFGSFSPSSKIAAFLTSNSRVILYDLIENAVFQVLSLDEDLCSSIAFLDEDTIVISTGSGLKSTSPVTGVQMYAENSLEIWDIKNKLKIASIANAHQGTIRPIIRIDDTSFISSSHDGLIRIWDISNDLLEETACSIAGRDLTEEEWNKYIGGAIKYSTTCEQYTIIPPYEGSTQKDFIKQILPKIGKRSQKKAEKFSFDPNLFLENEYVLKTVIENSSEEIIVEQPQFIQCRNIDKRWIYENDYIIVWPITLTGSGQIEFSTDYNNKDISLQAFFISKDGREERIYLRGLLHPGSNEIIVPLIYDYFLPLSGIGEATEILKFIVDSIPTTDTPKINYDVIPDIHIEDIVPHTHLNINQSDINFPMHSINLKFNNGSDYDINTIRMVAIVYDNNGDMIDLLINFTPESETPFLRPAESAVFTMDSYSWLGECVGYSDPFSPFKIRIWFSFDLRINGDIQYYQIYREVNWGGY